MHRTGIDRPGLRWLAASHAVTDVNQSAVPALLPFLVAERGLTYTAASGLVLASTVLSAVVQPSLGHLSDRRRLPWMAPLGVLTAGLGLAATGLLQGYAPLVVCLLLSGLGAAAFHPEGSRSALDMAPGRRATGMSFFTIGGNLGTALGPLVATLLASSFGVRGVVLLAIPATYTAWRLLRQPRGRQLRWELPGEEEPQRMESPPGERLQATRGVSAAGASSSPGAPAGRAPLAPAGERGALRIGAFLRLSGVIVLRSVFSMGLVTFVPLYLIRVRGVSPRLAGAVITAMLLVGIAGSFVGGRLADRHGRRKVMLAGLAPLPFLLFAFSHVSGPLAFLCLGAATAGSLATYTVAVVLGQEYLPGREGIAMGVTIGLAASIGGAGLPLLGMIADRWGLPQVLEVLAAVPAAALMVAFTLPREGRVMAERAPLSISPRTQPTPAPGGDAPSPALESW